MHEAGAVDKDIGRAERAYHLIRKRVDRRRRQNIELGAARRSEPLELCGIEVGRDHGRAFGDEGFADGAADPLPCGGDERDFTRETIGHALLEI